MGRLGAQVTVGDGAPAEEVSSTARPCPICTSIEHEVLYQQRFEAFLAGSITDEYDVVACRRCGACFASRLPEEARFAQYYGQSSKYDLSAARAHVSEFEARRYVDEAKFIAAHVTDRTAPVLDIGTATGDLLLALRGIGFSSLYGVEPSPDAARRARETNDLDVVVGDAKTAGSWNVAFGVVSLVAVLEHLVDPRSALLDATALLAPAGFLYLLVPDASRFRDHVDAPFQQFSVEHINYFTSRSLANLLSSIGLEVVAEQRGLVKGEDSDGPAIEVLCRRTATPPRIRHDARGADDLRGYIDLSAEKEAGLLERIAGLADDQRPIYVWGTGTHALHLLASSRLRECNILAFLDSNPHYSGQALAGRPVMAPHDVQRLEAPILVASAVSQTAIASAARDRFGADVPLILMYE